MDRKTYSLSVYYQFGQLRFLVRLKCSEPDRAIHPSTLSENLERSIPLDKRELIIMTVLDAARRRTSHSTHFKIAVSFYVNIIRKQTSRIDVYSNIQRLNFDQKGERPPSGVLTR